MKVQEEWGMVHHISMSVIVQINQLLKYQTQTFYNFIIQKRVGKKHYVHLLHLRY